MKNTLICTVGTSLFGNLKRLTEGDVNKVPNWKKLKDAFMTNSWKELAKELLNVESPKDRICGAEINTIEEAKEKNWLSLDHIVFLVSESEDGKNTGKVLEAYFEQRTDLGTSNIEVLEVEDLQDNDPKKFKSKGLRNLVRRIGGIINRKGQNNVAIDATGGYKAQIAVAVLMGQAMDIPVYYKHERFSEIIDFPPLPISLDYDILGMNSGLLTDFERGEAISSLDIGDIDEKLKVFLTVVEDDGTDERLYDLNPIGQLYLTTFRLRYPKAPNLRPATEKERKKPTFGNDHHYPSGFKDFVNKVWSENKWIKTCHSLPYGGQASLPNGISFYVKDEGEGNVFIEGAYKGDDFGAKYRILITNDDRINQNWVVDQLNQKYR